MACGLSLLLLACAGLVCNRRSPPVQAGSVPVATPATLPAAIPARSVAASVHSQSAPPPAVSRREIPPPPVSPVPAASAEPLLRIISESTNRIEIQDAVWKLANRQELSDSDTGILIRKLEALTTDPEDADLARTVIWALSLRPDLLPIERVTAFAVSHPDARVRRTAVRTLGASADPWATAALAQLAGRDVDAAVRREAVLHLALLLPPDELNALAARALVAEPDAALRQSWRRAQQLGAGKTTVSDHAGKQEGNWL